MTYEYHSYPINFSTLKHAFNQIMNNKSPIRIFHNHFLKHIEINDKTIDLGSGKHSSYLNFLKKKNVEIYFADKYHQKNENFIKLDLEDKLDIDDESYNSVILFNVLEHVQNYKNLINEINRVLKPEGKLEIFVPFMHRYHEDPKDVFRPTHKYLETLLENHNFSVKTHIIGVGPFAVISEVILKYFKFKILKMFFFIIFLILDKIIKIFSKDYNTFYLGVHCTCEKK